MKNIFLLAMFFVSTIAIAETSLVESEGNSIYRSVNSEIRTPDFQQIVCSGYFGEQESRESREEICWQIFRSDCTRHFEIDSTLYLKTDSLPKWKQQMCDSFGKRIEAFINNKERLYGDEKSGLNAAFKQRPELSNYRSK